MKLDYSVLCATVAASLVLTTATAPAAEPLPPQAWPQPDINTLSNDKWGELVRYGHALMTETYKYVGPEAADPGMRYAGNNFACQNCHQQAGTKKFGLPLIGVFADFPQYRPRENEIGTFQDRVNGCMQRSMNGKPLPLDSREMKALLAYGKFLSEGIPVGSKLTGRSTPQVELPNRAADPKKGGEVYKAQCVVCHGQDGLGTRRGSIGDGQGYTFPPLWGPDSYNSGAGMYRIITATRFIRSNMPLGASHQAVVLSQEQAYDVAAYINSQPRPIKANLEADFPDRSKKPADAAFPPWDDPFSAEQHKYGPFQPIIEYRKKRQQGTK